jgi:hypothetical protein
VVTKRSKIVGCAVAVAMLIVGLLYETRWREPAYQGRSLSEWLVMLDHAQPEDQLKVIAAVRHMGPRALPWLFDLLHARDSPDRQKVADFPNEYTAFSLRPVEPAERLRHRAIPALAALLDQRPNLIVEQLAQELLQTNSSGDVASLLAIAGTDGLAHVLQALTNPAPEVRSSAAMALSVPAQVLLQTNLAALRILGACGITQDALRMSTNAFSVAAIPALQRCLADPDPSVRRAGSTPSTCSHRCPLTRSPFSSPS